MDEIVARCSGDMWKRCHDGNSGGRYENGYERKNGYEKETERERGRKKERERKEKIENRGGIGLLLADNDWLIATMIRDSGNEWK